LNFTESFLSNCKEVLDKINTNDVDKVVEILNEVRVSGGRLFIIGSGGGAGHASHAVCDFRKLCNFEAYAPYDNISELTARVNDDGWDSTILNWLQVSKFNTKDCIFVFSVGGGNEQKNISSNIVSALKYAKEIGAKIVGIVGKDGGYTEQVGNAVILIPPINSENLTPITEGFQAVFWHLIVSHPIMQVNKAKWESTK